MEKNFGWTKVKNLYWQNEEGLSYYEGVFREDRFDKTIIKTIRFWAKHPRKTMSYIFRESKTIEDVEKFNGKSFNNVL